MLGNLLILAALIFVTLGLIFLAARLWRTKNLLVRFGGGVVASLVALIALVMTVAMARGAAIAYLPKTVPPADVKIAYTPERVARGKHLADSLCSSCHSTTGEPPLAGGANLSADLGLPLGDLFPPNITPAGRLAERTDGQIVSFFRQGRLPNGRLTIMPVRNMGNLSDEDLYSVIAFLRSQEPVESEVPPIHFSPLALIMSGANLIPLNTTPKPASITAPPVGPTAQYGEYIVSYNDCRECHGANLDGVVSGPSPVGPGLGMVKGWTVEQFISTMRTGVDPSGHELKSTMPWKQIGRLDDVELTALYEYLRNLDAMAEK